MPWSGYGAPKCQKCAGKATIPPATTVTTVMPVAAVTAVATVIPTTATNAYTYTNLNKTPNTNPQNKTNVMVVTSNSVKHYNMVNTNGSNTKNIPATYVPPANNRYRQPYGNNTTNNISNNTSNNTQVAQPYGHVPVRKPVSVPVNTQQPRSSNIPNTVAKDRNLSNSWNNNTPRLDGQSRARLLLSLSKRR